HHRGEVALEHHGKHAVDFFRACRARLVGVWQRTAGIGEEFHLQPGVHRPEDGRGIAVVGHVAGHGERVDAVALDPPGQVGAGERAVPVLLDVMVARAPGDLRVQFPARRALVERGGTGRRGVLPHHHRHAGRVRGVHRATDVGQRLAERGMLDRHVAVEVFVLHVDHDEGALAVHGELLAGGKCIHSWPWPGAPTVARMTIFDRIGPCLPSALPQPRPPPTPSPWWLSIASVPSTCPYPAWSSRTAAATGCRGSGSGCARPNPARCAPMPASPSRPGTGWPACAGPAQWWCRPGATPANARRKRCSRRCAPRTPAVRASSGCAWAPMCWPRPACSTIARPPRTGSRAGTSPTAFRACGCSRTCSTSTMATWSPRPAPPPASTAACTWCVSATAPRSPAALPGRWSSHHTGAADRRSTSNSRCRPRRATTAWPKCWTGCWSTSTSRTASTHWPNAH